MNCCTQSVTYHDSRTSFLYPNFPLISLAKHACELYTGVKIIENLKSLISYRKLVKLKYTPNILT